MSPRSSTPFAPHPTLPGGIDGRNSAYRSKARTANWPSGRDFASTCIALRTRDRSSLVVPGLKTDVAFKAQYEWLSTWGLEGASMRPARVAQISIGAHDGFFVINRRIKATFEHPFLVRRGDAWGFCSAELLQVGDCLITPTANGLGEECIDALERIDGRVRTVAIRVPGTNTSLAEGVRTHNDTDPTMSASPSASFTDLSISSSSSSGSSSGSGSKSSGSSFSSSSGSIVPTVITGSSGSHSGSTSGSATGLLSNGSGGGFSFGNSAGSSSHMGLTSWAGEKPRKTDITTAKNYLNEVEIKALNLIVSAYLDFAELQAMNRRPMTMAGWITKLDEFLKLTEREVLTHAGKISHDKAVLKASAEFEKYQVAQAALPQPVDQHFDDAVKQMKQLEEGRDKSKKPGSKPKRGRGKGGKNG
jgi:hypothetical protein